MKRLFPILALVIMMSACTKPEGPDDPVNPGTPTITRFSILGDSFSSFKGTVDPETNDVWSLYDTIGVTSAEQMWWYKVATEMEWVLEKNNSFSGSLMSNFWGFNAGPYYKPHSFINRMDNLGDPDVIFIQGGTNDVFNGAYWGEFVYSDWTEEDLEYYRPALAYMFDSMKRLYPDAKLYFMIDMWLCDYDPHAQNFVEDALEIAHHYNIDCIKLYDIHKSWSHPDAEGQEDIARQVLEVLESDFNV